MMILAIDPGTTTGWAINDTPVQYGHWQLVSKRQQSEAMRYLNLKGCLTNLLKFRDNDIGLVAYEEVRSHKGTRAAHIYGGLVATLMMWCETHGLDYVSVPVQHVKRSATGRGNASKDDVRYNVANYFRVPETITYDEADALAILGWAVEKYG